MSIRPINTANNTVNNTNHNCNPKPKKQIAFKGAENIVINTMDAIERGGFAASFIIQDFVGMAAPRIYTGYNRKAEGSDKPNYALATKEAIREVLSGPTTFIIPALGFAGMKKLSGSANNVSVNKLKALGEDFAEFTNGKDAKQLTDATTVKDGFYKKAFKTLISSTTEGKIPENEVNTIAESYANRLKTAENAKSKGFFNNFLGKSAENSKEDLIDSLVDDFSNLKKSHLESTESVLGAQYKTTKSPEALKIGNVKKFFTDMKNYTQDASSTIAKAAKNGVANLGEQVENFNLKRIGSRVASNFGIYALTVACMIGIPKLYKRKGGNPALAHANNPQPQSQPQIDLPENKEVKDANKQ